MNYAQLLLEVTLKATLILALAGLLNVLLRQASATARHLVWSLALGALLVLPLLASLLPGLRVPILPATKAVPVVVERDEALLPTMPITVLPDEVATATAPPSEAIVTAPVAASPARSFSWLGVVLAAWLTGFLFVGGRLLLGMWRVRRITREAECLTDYHWSAMTTRLRTQLALPAHISLYGSEAVLMPVTWGIWRPVVLLPAEAAQWSGDWRRIVLLHELAHIKRRDCLTQMLANWACALFWFHPLAWYAAQQLRVERELACDDYVLEVGTRASDYASYLVELAQAFQAVEPASPVAVGMACSQLESRVRAILNPTRKRSIPTLRRWLVWAAVTSFVLAPLASLRATAQEPVLPIAAVAEDAALPALAPAAPAEVRAKVAQLQKQQCQLDALEAKAEKEKLSAAENGEMARVQANLSTLQAELQGALASNLSRVEVPSVISSPSPELTPAPVASLNVIQPESYPAPLRVRSGKQAADFTPELALAIAAVQDAKQKEGKDKEQGLTADNLVRLKIAGVTPEYIEAMKRAGLEDLSVRQICELKLQGVTPEFIKQAQGWSNEKLSPRDIVNLKISGLTPEYINAIKQAGFDNLSVRRLSQMRLMGVTPEYIAAMKRAGFDNLTAEQVTQLKVQGVTEEYIKQVQGWGLGKLSVRDVLQIKIHGVKPEDAQAWKALGFDNLTLRDLTNIRIHGINADFIRQMRDLGFDKLSLEQLLNLKIHDVTPEYVRKMRTAGFKNISANDLVRMKIQGIDTILLKTN
ncbi:MAG: M56 family metallopeptidase [Blastocatellia bacterium]